MLGHAVDRMQAWFVSRVRATKGPSSMTRDDSRPAVKKAPSRYRRSVSAASCLEGWSCGLTAPALQHNQGGLSFGVLVVSVVPCRVDVECSGKDGATGVWSFELGYRVQPSGSIGRRPGIASAKLSVLDDGRSAMTWVDSKIDKKYHAFSFVNKTAENNITTPARQVRRIPRGKSKRSNEYVTFLLGCAKKGDKV